ncbi:hypothetical protein P3102_16265 [Amycolatopsis sp. QT-25]|uniref:hypothetical protein n=1 Tax=Amycolatopsis sp. QT-25 TaxID=3034022 RepID=UPI0023EAFAF0|nr:hypothetical protein [Amycolatopsis sp. QT-25]WET82644.1 hypothetical protein P3102_16265 [Amycolatopsis sp. QT-25]
MRTDLLSDPITGLDEALAVADAFDDVLVAGLLRPQRIGGLTELAEALAGSPLAARVAEAVEKTAAGAAGEDHFVSLAAARIAVFGSVHDAVLARLAEATGRPGEEEAVRRVSASDSPNLLAAARSWLSDLARAGWQGIDHDLISASAPMISALLAEPSLRRPAVLLDGFAAELAASCPGAASERVPARRWGDLWSRGMLLTLPAATPAHGTVTGRLLPLGVDLMEHSTAAQAQVHAVFEPEDGSTPRLVRASVTVPKPDTIVGAGIWQLLRPRLSLLTAIGEGRSMELTGMPVTAEGDLLWQDGHARVGEPADAFSTARVALPKAAMPSVAPLDRHPVRIAVPVFLEGYGIEGEEDALTFTFAGNHLAVETDRIPVAGPLTPKAVASSSACIGLIRWDGGFRLQPLAVETTVRKKTTAVHAGAWAGGTTDKAGVKAEKAATEAAAVLRERAGRLLRK